MRTLLLAGGGLTHALYLANARHLLPDGVRVRLLSPERFVPYASMLPALVAGHQRFRDCHIDLGQLCRATDTELVFGRMAALDPEQRRITLTDGETLDFDLLSLNTGLEPPALPGLNEHGMSARPISRFLPRWQEALTRLQARDRTDRADLAVIGGNIEGVEMALALRRRLTRDDAPKAPMRVHLIHAGGKLLPELPVSAQLGAAQMLAEREVRVHPLFEVSRIEPERVLSRREQHLPTDEVINCVSGAPGPWLAESGLARSDRGLLQVNQHLQSVSHPDIFAAGAVASVAGGSQPGSAATLAWRQAPVLAANLVRSFTNEPLRTFEPGGSVLSIIASQHDRALARYGQWVWGGKWVERWRQRRDRKVMSVFPRP